MRFSLKSVMVLFGVIGLTMSVFRAGEIRGAREVRFHVVGRWGGGSHGNDEDLIHEERPTMDTATRVRTEIPAKHCEVVSIDLVRIYRGKVLSEEQAGQLTMFDMNDGSRFWEYLSHPNFDNDYSWSTRWVARKDSK